MKPGDLTTTPVRDSQGYEIVYLSAADATTRTLHVIRISAPNPYTTKERPEWFSEFVFLDIQGDCADSAITLTESGLASPCSAVSASPTPAATPSPTPSPAR